MFSSYSAHAILFFFLVTLTAVDASLVGRSTGRATLRLTTRLNVNGTFNNIVERDRARAQAMIHRTSLGKRSTPEVGVTNDPITGIYTAQVGVGSPPTYYELDVDTGSAITWVGANKPYVPTKTSQNTGKSIFQGYGSLNFTGEVWNDTITLGSGLVIKQTIGVANLTYGVPPLLDGILGLSPLDPSDPSSFSVMDNLISQGRISNQVLGVLFIPANHKVKNGELSFGGVDDSVIVGPVRYVPRSTVQDASFFWGFEQSISYGLDIIMRPDSGIVDTGTTLIYIALDAFNQYVSKTGAIYDHVTTFWKITCEQYDKLKPLVFNIGNTSYKLTPNAQIWPRAINNIINGTPDGIYLIVQPLTPNVTDNNISFINGYTFLERFYSVYDAPRHAVGFAETKYTYSDIN